MLTNREQTWNCPVEARDSRCPDGCCGGWNITVISPKTGRKVFINSEALTKELWAKLRHLMSFGPRSDEDRKRPPVKAEIAFTLADMQSLLKHGHLEVRP